MMCCILGAFCVNTPCFLSSRHQHNSPPWGWTANDSGPPTHFIAERNDRGVPTCEMWTLVTLSQNPEDWRSSFKPLHTSGQGRGVSCLPSQMSCYGMQPIVVFSLEFFCCISSLRRRCSNLTFSLSNSSLEIKALSQQKDFPVREVSFF